MNNDNQGMRIPLQVGGEFRIQKDGTIVAGNPELELATRPDAADAVLSYRFDPDTGTHVIRLLEPVADRQHQATHRRGD